MTARKILALAMVLPIMAVLGWYAGAELKYRRDISGHLKRAANANTIETAAQELETALVRMEARGMTSGTTAVFYATPADDVGYWHRNLREAHAELKALPSDAAPLERSNMLLKLRETILEQDSDGEDVTQPGGIAVFPNNKAFALIATLLSGLSFAGCAVFYRCRRIRIIDMLVGGGVLTAAFLAVMFAAMA